MIAWAFMVCSCGFVVIAIVSVVAPPAGNWRDAILTAFAIALLLAFAWLFGRSMLVGVAANCDALLVCRALPGWVERIPFRNISYCRVRRWWLTGFLTVRGPGLIPSVLRNDRGPCGFEMIQDWNGMVAALREQLDPLGKWRE